MLTITEVQDKFKQIDANSIIKKLKGVQNNWCVFFDTNDGIQISTNKEDFHLHEIEIIEFLKRIDNSIIQPNFVVDVEKDFESVKSLETWANYVKSSTTSNIIDTWRRFEDYTNIFLINTYNIDAYIELIKDLAPDYVKKIRPDGRGGTAQSSTVNVAYIPFLTTLSKFFHDAKYKLNQYDNQFNQIAFNSLENIILYGPPGTGKTYKMQKDHISKFSKEDCFVTTFHQSFSYEEFVEGLKPFIPEGSHDVNYRVEPGLFYNACERAAILAGYSSLDECLADSFVSRKEKMKVAIEGKNTVLLCIDEINRANVSSVFGDLISLVESSKRLGAEYEMTAKLPYSKRNFGVPANLMIIGTMNTADRSIQLLDTALRRRFKFEELLPDYESINNEDAKKILGNINNRIRALLDKDHQIGHSYFIGVDSNLKILEVMKENIIPLLEEYFYNETEKIRRVLNETDELKDSTSHSTDYFYVLDEEAKEAVAETDDFNEEKPYYKLNEKLKTIKDEPEAKAFLDHLIG